MIPDIVERTEDRLLDEPDTAPVDLSFFIYVSINRSIDQSINQAIN